MDPKNRASAQETAQAGKPGQFVFTPLETELLLPGAFLEVPKSVTQSAQRKRRDIPRCLKSDHLARELLHTSGFSQKNLCEFSANLCVTKSLVKVPDSRTELSHTGQYTLNLWVCQREKPVSVRMGNLLTFCRCIILYVHLSCLPVIWRDARDQSEYSNSRYGGKVRS